MVSEKNKQQLRIKWAYLLFITAIIGVLFNVFVFYPGYMSNDSLAYLYQAKGLQPFDSLHPIFMALFWGLLIKVTGYSSVMLFAQVTLLWTGSFLISLFIYRKTKSRRWSAAALSLPLMPYVFNISGVLWSDVLFAGLMLLAVSGILWLGLINRELWRIITTILIVIILMMAIAVRYNTIPAVIPIIALVIYKSRLFSNKIVIASLSATIALLSIGILIYASHVTNVKDEKLINGPKLDDIVNIASRDEIMSNINNNPKHYLAKVYDCSVEQDVRLDVIHNCGAKGSEAFELAAPHTHTIQIVWVEAVINNPVRYISYKIAVFIEFLFPVYQSRYIWHEGIDTNNLGVEVKNPLAGRIIGTVIHNLFYRYLSFLYEPWFWLTVSGVVIYWSVRFRRSEYRHLLFSLGVSSVLVILSYFPTGATIDYRYIYWPAIAATVCVFIVATEMTNRKKLLTKVKKNNTA